MRPLQPRFSRQPVKIQKPWVSNLGLALPFKSLQLSNNVVIDNLTHRSVCQTLDKVYARACPACLRKGVTQEEAELPVSRLDSIFEAHCHDSQGTSLVVVWLPILTALSAVCFRDSAAAPLSSTVPTAEPAITRTSATQGTFG